MSSLSVYQSFYVINIVSRIFGVMPLKMMPGNRITGPICSMSILDYIYSILLLVVSFAHGVLAPFYVLHTIMPNEYETSIFTISVEEQQTTTVKNEIGSQSDEEEISDMATVMKILNPIMISVSSICSRFI